VTVISGKQQAQEDICLNADASDSGYDNCMTQPITHLIHHPYKPPDTFAAPQTGVYKASTVIFPSVAAMRSREWKDKSGYTYGLHGTPTTFILEERIASLEGGLHCVLVPSGLAAIANVDFALLATGDEVLIPDNAYGPGKVLAAGELAQFGITHRYYDSMDSADLAAKITHKTKLVWLEVPGSVTMEFPDLIALVKICKERGVLCALDNTWGAGLAFNAFDLERVSTSSAGAEVVSTPTDTPSTHMATPNDTLGVDISIQALTKYPSGGGDVLMGSVVTRDAALALKIKLTHMRMGWGVAANDAELVLRNLPSIALRYQAHDAAARHLAAWLQTRAEVEAVLHPALPGAPGYLHWKQLCAQKNNAQAATESVANSSRGQAAGLFSIVFKERYTSAQVDAFCDALQLFKLGYSWGGHVSLVVPYDIASMRDATVAHWLYRGTLVRFNIGLEDVRDLQADITQAMLVLASAGPTAQN
jgi:cysteine-S-conjugate beta-lyase